MKNDTQPQQNADRSETEDAKTKYENYELRLLNTVILMLSGYDTSPAFTINPDAKSHYQMGLHPEIVKVGPTVRVRHISPVAVQSMMTEVTHLGSAVHLLYRLQDALTTSYKDRQGTKQRSLAPSLIVLALKEPMVLNGREHGVKESYDWYWRERLGGFCQGLNTLLYDWRYVMFRIQEQYLKTLHNIRKEPLPLSFEERPEQLKSPLLELFERLPSGPVEGESYNRILNLYINLMPFADVMEALSNLIEVFLNYTATRPAKTENMADTMTELLITRLRASELAGDLTLSQLWKYLLFFTFKDRTDYPVNLATDGGFRTFAETMAKNRQLFEKIRKLDPKNYEKNLTIVVQGDLEAELLEICATQTADTEHRFMGYLNAKFGELIGAGTRMTEWLLNEKYRYTHRLYLLNSIALAKVGGAHAQFGTDVLGAHGRAGERSLNALFKQLCADWANTQTSNPPNEGELEAILDGIVVGRNAGGDYEVGWPHAQMTMKWTDCVDLFADEIMSIYSDTFNHMTKFMAFKERIERMVMARDRSEDSEARHTLLLLAHVKNCLVTYLTLVISHFWEGINRVDYGAALEDMKDAHASNIRALRKFLFAGAERAGHETGEERIQAAIAGMFETVKRIDEGAKEIGENNSDRVKRLFDDATHALSPKTIGRMVDWEKKRAPGPAGAGAHADLYIILNTFKNMLLFNHGNL